MIRLVWVAWALLGFAMPAGAAPAGVPLTGVSQISAGSQSCALMTGGAVKCWGLGPLGNGGTEESPFPVDVKDLADAVSITRGCAITSAGALKCWGPSSTYLPTPPTPTVVPGLESGVASVASRYMHRCVVTTGGGVKCWGAGSWGALGNGSTMNSDTPVDVVGLTSGVAAVGVGELRTCALTTAGGVKCWGIVLGKRWDIENGVPEYATTPQDVPGLQSGVAALSVGFAHACALLHDGSAKCWGFNASGELGDGTTTDAVTPVDVSGSAQAFAAIRAGWGSTCGLTRSGGVKCWGSNEDGRLGTGGLADSAVPQDVAGLGNDVVAIDVDFQGGCALRSNGTVACWGSNAWGQLGIGERTANATSPVTVRTLAPWQSRVAAGWQHTCARQAAGLKCWGDNASGQLGTDGAPAASNVPVPVWGFPSAASFAAGAAHTCAEAFGSVACWGSNAHGQLGNGTTTSSMFPVAVSGSGNAGVTALAAGSRHSCAVTGAGAAKCWGDNSLGQLGRISGDTLFWADVEGLSSGITDVSSGSEHSCALTAAGGVKCWGRNWEGQLGAGDSAPSVSVAPLDVVGLASGVAAVSLGNTHSCALTTSGGVKCWGSNSSMQLGLPAGAPVPMPVDVPGFASGVAAVAVGAVHSCALLVGGTVRCWGDNQYGQLGHGQLTTYPGALPPGDVQGLSAPAVAIGAGAFHTCAVLSTGAMQCWGRGYDGQLGNGRFGYSTTPLTVQASACADFLDLDPTSPFCRGVQWIRNREVTAGCAPNQYCPSSDITRVGMASLQKRLGTAMTPTLLAVQGSVGAFDPGYVGKACLIDQFAVTGYPRTAHVDAVFRGLPAGDLGLWVGIIASLDGGVTWQAVTFAPERSFAKAGLWANVHALADVDLEAGQGVRFGLAIGREGNASGTMLIESECNLRVRIESRDGNAAPF